MFELISVLVVGVFIIIPYLDKKGKERKVREGLENARKVRNNYKVSNVDFRDLLNTKEESYGIFEFANMRLVKASKYALNILPSDKTNDINDNHFFDLEIYINRLNSMDAIDLNERHEIQELLSFERYSELKRHFYPVCKTNYTTSPPMKYMSFIGKEIPCDLIQELYDYLKKNSNFEFEVL